METNDNKTFLIVESIYLKNLEKDINNYIDLGYTLIGDVKSYTSGFDLVFYACMEKRNGDVENKKQIL
jgi:hypothetical protein